MKKVLFMMVIIVGVIFGGGMKFSNPKPTFDNPRRIIMKLNMSDEKEVNHLIGTIYNILKEYPSDTLKVVVIAYGPGMRVLKKDYDKHTLTRIKSLMEYEVDFIGCKNTMGTMKWTKKDFIDNIDYVQAGIAEVIEKKVAGWIDATPY